MDRSRIFFQIPALVLAVIGFILIFVSLSTPAWQVVYARELQQWVQSGLWLSCHTRPSGMYTCTYTFTKDDFDFYTNAEVVNLRTPAFFAWQRTLLHLLLVAQAIALVAFISFCISNAPNYEKASAIAFNVLIAVTTTMGFGCLLAFSVFAHMVEYRFYHVSVSGIYEKHHGYSFYTALFGCIFYLLALIVSVIYTVKTVTKERWAGGSADSVNDYHKEPYQTDYSRRYRQEVDYRPPGMQSFSSEDQFAMRSLPPVPGKRAY